MENQQSPSPVSVPLLRRINGGCLGTALACSSGGQVSIHETTGRDKKTWLGQAGLFFFFFCVFFFFFAKAGPGYSVHKYISSQSIKAALLIVRCHYSSDSIQTTLEQAVSAMSCPNRPGDRLAGWLALPR